MTMATVAGVKAMATTVVAMVAEIKAAATAGASVAVRAAASTVVTAVVAAVVVLALSVPLSGCVKLWKEESPQCIPFPETEISVTPYPWEPPVTESGDV